MKKYLLLIATFVTTAGLSACDDLRFTAPLPLDVKVTVAGDESCDHITFTPVSENANLYHHYNPKNPNEGYPTNDTVTKNGIYHIGTLLPSSTINTTFIVTAQCLDANNTLLSSVALKYEINSKMTNNDVPVYTVTAKNKQISAKY